MRNYFLTFFMFVSILGIAQNEESSTRKFIDKAQFTQINKDWNTIANFSSGIGEYVNCYTIEDIDLKKGKTINDLKREINNKK